MLIQRRQPLISCYSTGQVFVARDILAGVDELDGSVFGSGDEFGVGQRGYLQVERAMLGAAVDFAGAA